MEFAIEHLKNYGYYFIMRYADVRNLVIPHTLGMSFRHYYKMLESLGGKVVRIENGTTQVFFDNLETAKNALEILESHWMMISIAGLPDEKMDTQDPIDLSAPVRKIGCFKK
jgi:hypothetical protein